MKTNSRTSGMQRHNRSFVTSFVGLVVLSGSLGFPTKPENIIAEYKDAEFLQRYGILKEPEQNAPARFHGTGIFENSIDVPEESANVRVAGKLDTDTLKLMSTPQCGLHDKITSNSVPSSRQKRYILQGSKWNTTNLSYRVTKYSTHFSTSSTDDELQKAFSLWSKVTPLKFTQKTSGNANIDIRFVVGDHNDRAPFDGPGQTLAHAFYPQHGGIHFDDDENWTTGSPKGLNFFQVAVHQIGHSLGLEHSRTQSAMMYPFYRGYVSDLELDGDDIRAIQALYGPPDGYTFPNTTETTSNTPINPAEGENHPRKN